MKIKRKRMKIMVWVMKMRMLLRKIDTNDDVIYVREEK